MSAQLDPTSLEFAIKEQLAALDEALEKKITNVAAILRPLHANLKKDPALVTLLTDEECSIIARGLAVQTNTNITTKLITSKRPKALSKVSVSDL